ncbi:F0F1 ATP synthase subunit B' [Hwanghaeella grinnelliae]|uniref:ATP synthase subunit b n=1 Tax=Hwanghaeella grinnelliae TaxID=2500179 RepID=A0A3S2WQJ1_9PROT|nr:F0F1 ATP synthase subunit B' [Hwanghaeella grinnelliae]RVU35035.1 F0F1 ATP synthase subunit B' [Hwanghaeella grinnelliae]
MPQFEQLDTFASQIFWLIVTFSVLYIILSRMVLPRIGTVVTTRQKKIDDDLGRAESLKQKAATVQEAYEESLAKAAEDARAVHRQAAEEIAAKSEKAHAKLGASLADDAKQADDRIAESKTATLEELQAGAVEVVQAATERLIGVSVDESAARAALETAGGSK